LAALYESQGRYSEAEPLFLQAFEILFNRFGENHPTTQTVRQNFCGFVRQAMVFNRALPIDAGQKNTRLLLRMTYESLPHQYFL
jgi:hypothetical protein